MVLKRVDSVYIVYVNYEPEQHVFIVWNMDAAGNDRSHFHPLFACFIDDDNNDGVADVDDGL